MERYGYSREQIRMRFYVGKFIDTKRGEDERIVKGAPTASSAAGPSSSLASLMSSTVSDAWRPARGTSTTR